MNALKYGAVLSGIRPLLLVGLSLLPAGAVAQAPSGSYVLGQEGTAPEVRLWDFSGPKAWDFRDALEWIFNREGMQWPWGNCELLLDLVHDAKGKITAADTTESCSGGDSQITVTCYKVKGSVRVKRGVTTVKLSYKFRGVSSGDFDFPLITGVVKETLEVDAKLQKAAGTILIKAKAKGLGSEKWTEELSLDLPETMDGLFLLSMDLVSEKEKKLSGDGTLALSNGRLLDLSVKGTYRAKTGATKLALKGSDADSRGVVVKIHAADPGLNLTMLKMKALGQKAMLKGGSIGNLNPLPPPAEADFVGTWSGVMTGRVGTEDISQTMALVLRPGGSLEGLFYTSEDLQSPDDVLATLDETGVLSLILTRADPDDPDCQGWNVSGTARLLGDRSRMNVTVSGTFCGSAPGEVSGTLIKQVE